MFALPPEEFDRELNPFFINCQWIDVCTFWELEFRVVNIFQSVEYIQVSIKDKRHTNLSFLNQTMFDIGRIYIRDSNGYERANAQT